MRGNIYHLHPSQLFFLVIFLSFPPVAMGTTQSLSLPEAMSTALSRNTIIQYSGLGEKITENKLNVEESIYIPDLRADISSVVNNMNAQNPLDISNFKANLFRVSASAKNSAGGISSLIFNTRKDVELPSSELSSREFVSEVFLKYEQPLLRGLGRDVTNLGIDKALLNRALSSQISEDVKTQILYNVFRDYFSLFRVTEELRLQREIRNNTEDILGMVREKVDARVLPVTELKTVEAMLSMQDRRILDLVNRRRQQANQLMISIQNEPLKHPVEEIVLLSSPDDAIRMFVDPEPAATRIRMEEKDIELIHRANEMALLEKDKLKAVNDLKPELNLTVEAGIGGIDDDSITRSIGNLSSRNYRTLFAGTLSLPVINTAAKSALAETQNRLDQVNIQISNRKNEIGRISGELFDNFRTVRKKLELDRNIVSLTKNNLDNEIERLLRGKSTAVNTFDYQTNFINARFDMLNTTVEYSLLIGLYYVYVRDMEIFMKPYP